MNISMISVAGTGVYVTIIEFVLHQFGIVPQPGTVLSIVNDTITVAGWIFIIIGQFKRADLNFGIVRK